MRKLSLIVSVLALVILAVMPTFAQEQSIVEIATGTEDFSTLVAAIQNADPAILETLSGDGPFTVFAPTNQAFQNLLDMLGMSAEELLAETDLLTTVLLYHVIDGAFPAEAVIGLDGQSAPTLLEGESIGITIEEGTVVLNGVVEVINPDVTATNGVIHVINDVLLPQPVLDSLAAEDEMAEEEEMMMEDVNIRVAHFSPDTPAVDVYVNGEAAITELAFNEITDFVTLPAGTYELAVAPAGTSIDDAAIGPADFDLPAGAYLTVTAIGSLEAGTLAPAIVAEDFGELAENTARVTVFHAIEDAPAVDVVAGGETVVIPSLAFPGTEGENDGAFTLDLEAGTYDLGVVPAGATEPVVIDLTGTTFEADSYYFVAATGTLENPSVALTVVAAEDMMMEEDMGDDMGSTPNIVGVAMGNEDFSILVSAIVNADPSIVETLSGEGEFTVFAPTNAAFEALLEALGMTADELLAETEILNQVLLYHVVAGTTMAETVVTLDGQSVPTLLEGAELSISVTEDGVFLNDTVGVIETDIVASNGVIHVIDAVLVPQVVLDALGM